MTVHEKLGFCTKRFHRTVHFGSSHQTFICHLFAPQLLVLLVASLHVGNIPKYETNIDMVPHSGGIIASTPL